MSKRQLRKSISLSPGAYEELHALASRSGLSKAAMVERWIAKAAQDCGINVDHDEARERSREAYAEMRERKAAEVEKLRMEAFG